MEQRKQKVVIFAVTFISYALFHSSRKAMSGVKSAMTKDWVNTNNDTHQPFITTADEAKDFQGTLDAVFMAAYASALFFWGWLGDRLNPKHVIAAGMVGSAITLTAFGAVPVWLNFYSEPFYIVTYVLFGLVQACGWPSEVAIMAAWFGTGHRGLIMGLWASCQPVGNILGGLLTSVVLHFEYHYQYTFLINAMLICAFAIVVMVAIDTHPSSKADEEKQSPADEVAPISMWKAILLPGVLMYCVCNACLKFVNYAFFFWLPLYITEAYKWNESHANNLAVVYDVGGIIGSVAGGYISDKMGCRTPLIVGMLASSLGAMYLYANVGPDLALNILAMLLVGITVSGPYNLIVGAVSIDLGREPKLAANSRALCTVSGIIDGAGSLGSSLGQYFIPHVQHSGWQYVFYMFIALNGLAGLSILHRAFIDVRHMRRTVGDSN